MIDRRRHRHPFLRILRIPVADLWHRKIRPLFF